METIRFVATIGKDQMIHPLDDVVLPEGVVEVTVVARPAMTMLSQAKETPATEDSLDSLRAMLLEFAAEAERLAPPLPTDMAMNHDHYAHGKPLP